MEPIRNEGIPLGLISPWYLHSNSTSHTSVFSAIAELIDNAYDPDVSAKQFWIDKTKIKDQDCLIFMDNGKGMNYDKMRKMLSFGFSIKQTESPTKNHEPVGQYGNGFKSGSMRLGKDVLVFSKKDDIMCVGLLSQTYLEEKQYVMVPIVELTNTGHITKPEHKKSLHAILTSSLCKNKEELLAEFSVIESLCTNSCGTRIIIWNLRRTSPGELEFEVIKNRYDIRVPVDDDEYDDVDDGTRKKLKRNAKGSISVPDSKYSLRAYCSILYLNPRMEIILQGQKVETQPVTKTLADVSTDTYKPVCDPPLETELAVTFGFNTKSKEHYGLMMYHKNRLIKAYERVACQRKAKDSKGVGVIGVIECNHLKPTHNKQDFVDSVEYRRTMASLGKKLEDYWRAYTYAYERNYIKPFEEPMMKQPKRVQCNDCQKKRKLPDGIDPEKLPKEWFCYMNSDPQFRSCEVEEEPEDPDEEPRNQKKNKPQNSKQQKKMQQRGKNKSPIQSVKVQVHPLTNSSIQITPPTQNMFFPLASKRNEKDLCLDKVNPVKKKARTEDFVQCEVVDEEEVNNHSMSTQHSHSTYPSGGTQELFISDTVKHCADNGAYRFQCSDAGQFQCKLTNLVFEIKASGNVIYKVLSWENSQLERIGQFKPAGPLYEITSLQSSSFDLLLPHCEINTDTYNNPSGLAVAEFSEGSLQILQRPKITNTHVTLDIHGSFLFGLIKKSSGGKHINAQVLLFYEQIIGTQMGKKLYIHLLPGNVSVKEVQKQHPGNKYVMCSTCQLIPGKKYKLLCEPGESQPMVETFNCDYDTNYHPTFEMILNTEDEDFNLSLLDEFSHTVWETLLFSPTGY
ncbi:MORC family CW-type zinc finger protein 3-like [Clarias gariepinus]|uniref:MORC family CW-type zinc finger protein 3-like n=1 Tax=Clarias gariepinus TaxID=13013 RepID=UPI00234D8610|nr:MORC family CW-type zinc finger protein 3-like [Clarias gariepinus]